MIPNENKTPLHSTPRASLTTNHKEWSGEEISNETTRRGKIRNNNNIERRGKGQRIIDNNKPSERDKNRDNISKLLTYSNSKNTHHLSHPNGDLEGSTSTSYKAISPLTNTTNNTNYLYLLKSSTKLLTILSLTFLLLTSSLLLISYQNKVDFTKAWIPLNQIAISYNNPSNILGNNNKIDTIFLDVTLQNISDTYGLVSSSVLNIGGINSAGSVIIGSLLKISTFLTADPSTKELYINGTLKVIPNDNITCTSTKEGTIIYNQTSKQYEICSNGEWFILKKIPKGLKIRIYNPNDYSLTDFQVKINISKIINLYGPNFALYTDTGIPINYCFIQVNGECNQTYTGIDEIWAKIPSLYGNENTWIMIKPTTSNQAKHGEQVFDFYDDFNDGIWNDKWEEGCTPDDEPSGYYCNGEVIEQNGYLMLRALNNTTTVATWNLFLKKSIMQNFRLSKEQNIADSIWEIYIDLNKLYRISYSGIVTTSINNSIIPSYHSTSIFLYEGSGTCPTNAFSFHIDPDHRSYCTSLSINPKGFIKVGITNRRDPGPKLFVNDTYVDQALWTPPSSDNPNGEGLGFWFKIYNDTWVYYDWALVRKYSLLPIKAETLLN